MRIKHNKEEKQDEPAQSVAQKQSSGRRKALRLVLWILILGAASLLMLKYGWEFYNDKLPPPIPKVSSVELRAGTQLEGCPIGDEELITRFAPEQEEIFTDSGENVDPYDNGDNGDVNEQYSISEAIAVENLYNNLDDYRTYLANANELLLNFYKEVPFSKNLTVVKTLQLPKEIEEIIAMFETYNAMLSASAPGPEKVVLWKPDIFEKFLKITKEPAHRQDMKALNAEIEKRMDLFTAYIFSLELQDMFLK